MPSKHLVEGAWDKVLPRGSSISPASAARMCFTCLSRVKSPNGPAENATPACSLLRVAVRTYTGFSGCDGCWGGSPLLQLESLQVMYGPLAPFISQLCVWLRT